MPKVGLNEIKNKYKNSPIQIRASVWFLICSFLQRGISVVTTPIFTRLLDTAQYGEYSVFNSWLSIVSIFVSLNMSAGVFMQGLVKFEKDKKIFASSLQGLTTLLTVIWLVIYLAFSSFWNELLHISLYQGLMLLVLVWTGSVFNFWATEKRVDLEYKSLVIVSVIVSILKPVIGIILVTHVEDKVNARIFGIVIVELVIYSPMFVRQIINGKKMFSPVYWPYAMSFSIPLIPHYLSQNILNSADRIMISSIVGESEAGIYSLAYSVAQLMSLFSSALLSTISPWIYQKIRDKRTSDISNVAYVTLIFMAIVNVLLILFAPEIVYIFAPKEYIEAIWIIPPVAMSVFFSFAYNIFAAFEFYYKKPIWIAFASISGAVINVILNYLFIPIFGYIAAGYTTLLCYIIYMLLHYVFMNIILKREMHVKNPFSNKVLLLITFVFVLCSFIGLALYNHFVLRLVFIILAFANLVIFRNKIINAIKQLIQIRTNK